MPESGDKPEKLRLSAILMALAMLVIIVQPVRLLAQECPKLMRNAFRQPGAHLDFAILYLGALDIKNTINPQSAGDTSADVDRRYHLGLRPTIYFPLITYLIYAPLTQLSLPAADALWVAISVLLLFASIATLWRWLRAGSAADLPLVALLVFLALSFEPVYMTLSLGQINLLILLLLCLVGLTAGRKRDYAAGSLLVLAALIKPVVGIVFINALLQRRFKIVVAGLVVGVLMVAASLLLLGPQVNQFYVDCLRYWTQAPSIWWANEGVFGFLLRAFTKNSVSTPWLVFPELAYGLWIALSVLLVGLASIVTLSSKESMSPLTIGIWLTTGLLIANYSFEHYMVWLLIPISYLALRLANRCQWKSLVALAVSYEMISFATLNTSKIDAFHHGPLLVFTSLPMFGVILLFVLLWRTARSAGGERSP